MSGGKVVAVSRAGRFSPGNVANDRLVLECVCAKLRQRGYDTAILDEDEAVAAGRMPEAACYINMARGAKALALLAGREREGAMVVNSASALLGCDRVAVTEKLAGIGVPVPAFRVIDVGSRPRLSYPCWIKRGDECSQVPADVSHVASPEELEAVWRDYSSRGIRRVVACEHVCGDLVKFYGVCGTGFFVTFYPTCDGGAGKFGNERLNGEPKGYAYGMESLRRECEKASTALGIPVYGGDCVVEASGNFKIIDFNDWPSYSRCRDAAAEAIAGKFAAEAGKKNKQINSELYNDHCKRL